MNRGITLAIVVMAAGAANVVAEGDSAETVFKDLVAAAKGATRNGERP